VSAKRHKSLLKYWYKLIEENMQPYYLTLHQLQELYRRKELSPVEVTEKMLGRIDLVEKTVGAYLTVDKEGAMAQAKEAEKQLASGRASALCGIPLSIKDVLCTKGLRTTCGSRILESFVPVYDATVVSRLKEAGAVILGKVSMDEFAMGSSNENCAFGVPRNPLQPEYVCGGSSGGSAASIAAGECTASLGSDTGGSIRQPASYCGVVGLKPTYGRVSRYGLIAYASSLDQVGPLTRDVSDCAILLQVISGFDPRDSTSVDQPVPDYRRALERGLKGLKVGIPKEYFIEGLDPEVASAAKDGIAALQAAGAELIDVSLPHTEYGVAAYYIIAPAEASSNLARYDGVRYGFRDPKASSLVDMYRSSRSQGFGPEVKRRIMIGTYALSAGYYDAYYKKASQVRALIMEDFRQAFQQCDVIASPVTPTPAWKIGEKIDDPLSMYLSDILTIPSNLAGLPGISIPCALSSRGLPIGFQLQAAHFEEQKLLKAAYNLEQELGLEPPKPVL
jgi:aspartyl-tRNA(Asn)/glutamyl-tRNA(Gln) amidotransferase subunit A